MMAKSESERVIQGLSGDGKVADYDWVSPLRPVTAKAAKGSYAAKE